MTEDRRSLSRTLRDAFTSGAPILGVVIILCTVLFVRELSTQLVVVGFGILIVGAGVWNMANWVMPNERQYLALRVEGDKFIFWIKRLNRTALALKANDTPENQQALEQVRQTMHQSVERMAEVAGKTEQEMSVRSEVAV